MTLPPFPRRVAVLGATGSIGRKALAVAERHPDRFQVVALSARGAVEDLAEAARRHRGARVVLADPAGAPALRAAVGYPLDIGTGPGALAALAAHPEVDLVVNAVVGRAGLEASLAAAAAGKMLALANKESLVLAGDLLLATARQAGGTIVPVDSEHSGLFQCLDGRPVGDVKRVVITASGGPFRGFSRHALREVTPEQALQHPIWPMGRRITVDSATLFNKGLEVLETKALFGFSLEQITVWVHPQSVVHALVEWRDGSFLAQISAPDMLLPVQYAMTYPERLPAGAPSGDLTRWGTLVFEEADREAFPALDLAYRAAALGGTAPAALNAADEVAVEAFLARRLPFPGIAEILAEVLDRVPVRPADSLAAIDAADREARSVAAARVGPP